MRLPALVLTLSLCPVAVLAQEQPKIAPPAHGTHDVRAPDASVDPTVVVVQRFAKTALELQASPRASAWLYRMHSMREDLADLTPLANTYAALIASRTAHPLVKATAQRLLLEVERARGRQNRAQELSRELGFVHDFYVLGAFDNEGKAGCDKDVGPEAKLDLEATYPAKGGHEVGWRKTTLKPLDGYVDLSTLVRPNKEVTAYALTYLDAKAEQKAVLDLGTSGGYRLWVNGALASKSDRYNQPRPDQSRVEIPLHRGMNQVLLKVCQESGQFGFFLRQEGSRQASVVLPGALPAIAKAHTGGRDLPTLTSALEAEVKAHPDDAALRGDWATVLGNDRSFDEKDKTDTQESNRAADAAPDNALLQLVAASHQEDENQRLNRLNAALKADPQDPHARLSLASLSLARNHPERARDTLQALLQDQPKFTAAKLLLSRADDAVGDWAKAVTETEALFQSSNKVPNVARQAARVSRRLDRFAEAESRLRLVLALRADDTDTRRALAELLADEGKVQDAAQQLARIVETDPYDNNTRLRLADLLASNGQLDAALARYAEAKALSPDEPEVFEREGRALLSSGRRDEAVKAFEHSLSLRPQNPALRESLRALQGENANPALQYAFDVKSLVKEADAFAGEDAVTLADYTYTRVQPTGLSSRFQQLAVKVYTQRGVEAFRTYPITYSPDRQEVRVLRARITKPDGSVVESYGDQDRNINEPWTGMYYDARAKVLSFPSLAAGDVLELQYRLDDTAQDNLLSDYWGDVDYVQSTTAKVRYQYLVDMPAGRALHWNQKQLGPGVAHAEEKQPDGRTLYKWSAKSVSKIVPEPSMPGWSEVATTLHVSTYETWDQVGRYYWGLVRDQLEPDDELRRTVDKVLAKVNRKDDLAVIRAIYDFVVTNTRYVALEFGIHGYKPYRVGQILARRFGDCKDKASLIHAMLQVAGVDSRMVLLRMRHLGGIGEEPASLAPFNHAIAYVPKYDLFLDGTAEFHGSGELASADRVADVLVVNPDGTSKFYVTPEAKADQNLTTLALNVALRPDGRADVTGKTVVTGQNAPDYRRAYQAVSSRKATFEQGWAQSFPGLAVQDVSITEPTAIEQNVEMNYKMSVPRYGEVLPAGLRLYPFGSGRAYTQSLAPLTERRFDLVMQSPWTNRFQFTYTLPDGYSATDLPSDLDEESPFGHLKLAFKQEGGKLICNGEMQISTARVSAKDYPQFRAFLTKVDQAFSRKLLVQKNGQTASR